MANQPNCLSAILDKSNSLKCLANLRFFSMAVFISLISFSVQADSSKNDSDGDGLIDTFEVKIGSESYLSDTDGDTIKDGDEVGENPDKPTDTDNDGIIDVLDYDDDNDGLPTYLESKKDTDKDGLKDYLDADSDNDGITDGEESGFLNQDKNLDGIDDAFDLGRDGAVDNNGDGIDDNVKLPDHNADGKPDYLDAKFQRLNRILVKKNNTKAKSVVVINQAPKEKPVTMKKAITAEIIPVVVKSLQSAKPINMIINRHTDSDNDGLSNSLEKILGTNPLSRDSDGDMVSDAIEIGLDVNSPQDSDHDGIIDALDNDDDNDGILTKLEDINKDSTAINDDTDADGVPNYLDANDDGDNFLTKAEGATADRDNDGILDYLDKSDGVKDQSNASNTLQVNDENEEITEPEIVVLFDGDASALAAEEDVFQDLTLDLNQQKILNTIQDRVQDNILSYLEGILENSGLNEDKVSNTMDENSSKIRASTSTSKPKSHWNLF